MSVPTDIMHCEPSTGRCGVSWSVHSSFSLLKAKSLENNHYSDTLKRLPVASVTHMSPKKGLVPLRFNLKDSQCFWLRRSLLWQTPLTKLWFLDEKQTVKKLKNKQTTVLSLSINRSKRKKKLEMQCITTVFCICIQFFEARLVLKAWWTFTYIILSTLDDFTLLLYSLASCFNHYASNWRQRYIHISLYHDVLYLVGDQNDITVWNHIPLIAV